jgi:hypothetical protein
MDRVVVSAARKIEESVSGEERRGDRALNAFQLDVVSPQWVSSAASPSPSLPPLPHVTPFPCFRVFVFSFFIIFINF